MPEDILGFISQFGITTGILVWAAIGLIKLIKDVIPGLVNDWRASRVARQEHELGMEAGLIATQQSELKESYKFIRDNVNIKLDNISVAIESLDNSIYDLAGKQSMLIGVVTSIYDERNKSEADIEEPDRAEPGRPDVGDSPSGPAATSSSNSPV